MAGTGSMGTGLLTGSSTNAGAASGLGNAGGGGMGSLGGWANILGDAGTVITAGNTMDSIKGATSIQLSALNQIRQNLFQQLDPETVQALAQLGSQKYAAGSLALQKKIDPALVAARYGAEGDITKWLAQANDVNRVSSEAAQNVLAAVPQLDQNAAALTASANALLAQGATLPQDVQNEVVQRGLEQGAAVTGGMNNAHGITGTILKNILGTAGQTLRQQREAQASGLLTSASNVNTLKQNLLTSLFPSLSQAQFNTLEGQQYALGESNNLMPASGITGSDVASIWLSRMGAVNQNTQNAADVRATGTLARNAAKNQQLAGYTKLGSDAISMIAGG